MVTLPQIRTVPMILTKPHGPPGNLLMAVVESTELVHGGFFLLFNGKSVWSNSPETCCIYFLRNDTRNDADTSPLKIKLATEGLLILLIEEISTRMNQIGHRNQQSQSTEWKTPLCLPITITMAQVITTLNAKCIYIKIANEASCNCAKLGSLYNNMNLTEGNTIIHETQFLSSNREIN